MFTRLLVLFILMVIIDLVNHFGFKTMLKRTKDSYSYKFILITNWAIGIALILSLFITLGITGDPHLDFVKYRIYFLLFGFWLIIYLPRLVFANFVIFQNIFYLLKSILNHRSSYTVKRGKRRKYIIQKIGLAFAIFAGFIVIYGMIWGKSNYKIQPIDIYIDNLPKSFEGFKIAHFSDAHLGSFKQESDVRKGLKLMQKQNADLIVFSGDMVNNIADEMEVYFADLSKLSASFGKYSILGNHDMSDYVKWKKFEMKQSYINKLIDYQEKCGFKLLLNQHVIIHKGKDSIALIGVENWGLPPFKQYGDLKMAMDKSEKVAVKILISHDPTHWTEQVVGKTDIDLTLSGHTHGMQFGIDSWGIRWSPIKYLYKHWFGLYHEGNQYLYVNPGFGYIAFPGRIGIQPEITIITLHSK